MARQNRTVEQCAEAIRNAGGFITTAAKMLGMSQPALSKRIAQSETLRSVVEETREKYLDLAESKLIKAINNDAPWAICFYLKCKGKQRGYVEKQVIESDNRNLNVNFIAPEKYQTPEEWENENNK